MMMFQIGEAVRHIAFARQERFFPDRDAIAQDAAGTLDMRRRGADQQFRAKRGLPQLGMGEPQIIVPLGHMVAELVGQRQAEPIGLAVIAHDVDARQFRLLAAIPGKGRHGQRFARPHQLRPVALVKPFGLLADGARRGLAARQPFQEHAHGIGLAFRRRCLAVHLVAAFGGAKMGQARAGQLDMRVIVMVDGGEQFARCKGRGNVDRIARACRIDRGAQADVTGDRVERQGADAGIARHDMGGIALRRDDGADAAGGTMLQQAQCHEKTLLPHAIRGAG